MSRSATARAAPTHQPQAPAVHTTKSSRAHVWVGCKLGAPWLEIQMCRPVEVKEPMQGGGFRDTKEYRRDGKIVRLRGLAYPTGQTPAGFITAPKIVNGASVNKVDRAFWDAWVEQNRLNPLVMNRIVFAMDDIASLEDFAADYVSEKSGLEAIIPDPDKDSRVPRPASSKLSVGTEDSMKDRLKGPAMAESDYDED